MDDQESLMDKKRKMMKIFSLVLRVFSVHELVTKYRRASTRARHHVFKQLSTIKERILYINYPKKVLEFPKKLKGKRHFIELFNVM